MLLQSDFCGWARAPVLCPMSYILCPVSCVLCPVSYVMCPVSYVLCPMAYVLCPMYGLCPMSHVLCPTGMAVLVGELSWARRERMWLGPNRLSLQVPTGTHHPAQNLGAICVWTPLNTS